MYIKKSLDLSNYRNAYVIGDIHGSFKYLEYALKKIDFDKNQDVLICTGDLIGRGKETYQVLNYLNSNWFFSVLGNHDMICLYDVLSEKLPNKINEKLFSFVPDTYEMDLYEKITGVEEVFSTLPLIYELTTKTGEKVVISHASLPVNKNYEEEKGKIINNIEDYIVDILWNRVIGKTLKVLNNNADLREKSGISESETFYEDEEEFQSDFNYYNNLYYIEDLKAVFHGHNIVVDNTYTKDNVLQKNKIGNRYLIDTGGYRRQKYKGKTKKESHIKKYEKSSFTIVDINSLECVFFKN
tara:strand:+ start:30374 stop:31267 length:894 start_codon:yes stop_codon:yes gene_type:complete